MAHELVAEQPQRPFMAGNVMQGKEMAVSIMEEVSATVRRLKAWHGKEPGLAVVIVGERKHSQTYVHMKRLACEEVGVAFFGAELPATATQQEVLSLVQALNANQDVHGILVQLPLPRHIDEAQVLSAISVEKDVDGLHPMHMGRLAMKGREPLFVSCTALGCIELLERTNTPIKGQHAVVIGRSNIVGMPVALLLLKRDATVTVCHSATQDMEALVQQADIVVAAVGQEQLVKGSWLKPGAVVIDVGTNYKKKPRKKADPRLVGDCAYEECKQVAGAINVPGGVGVMAIAMLLKNTVDSAGRFFEGKCRHAGQSVTHSWLPSWITLAAGSLVTAALQVLVKAWGRSQRRRR